MSQCTERFFRALHEFHRMKVRFTQHIGPPLPPGEFFFLERLCDCHGPDGVNLSLLRDKGHMSPPAVSQMLASLERKGLIERSVSRQDRRQTLVMATEKGRAVIDEARQSMNAKMEEVIEKYGEDRAEQLTELLEGLNLVISDTVYDERNEVKEP